MPTWRRVYVYAHDPLTLSISEVTFFIVFAAMSDSEEEDRGGNLLDQEAEESSDSNSSSDSDSEEEEDEGEGEPG